MGGGVERGMEGEGDGGGRKERRREGEERRGRGRGKNGEGEEDSWGNTTVTGRAQKQPLARAAVQVHSVPPAHLFPE